MKIYGIKNCDSVKKALNFLTQNNITYNFHDYKKSGANQTLIKEFIQKFSLEKVLNKKGTTYKKLSESLQNTAQTQEGAISLMTKNTSLIKRPIILGEGVAIIGFDEAEYKKKLL